MFFKQVRVFNDGSLYLTKIQLINGGNYSCHAQRNKDVLQTHILTVHSKLNLDVSVENTHLAACITSFYIHISYTNIECDSFYIHDLHILNSVRVQVLHAHITYISKIKSRKTYISKSII